MTTPPGPSASSLRSNHNLLAKSPLRLLASLTLVLATGNPAGAAPPDYNLAGVEVCTTITPAPGGVVNLEISTDPNFLPTVNTLAGNRAGSGSADGPRLTARFEKPSGVAIDSTGNFFIADTANHLIRMLGPDGMVSTIAGTGSFGLLNGTGGSADFAFPGAVAVGPNDNLYVADTFNHCIRKITRPATPGGSWTVTTLAGTGTAGFFDGAGSVASFSRPQGLTLDAAGNVYVADSYNHRIRKVTPTGRVSTFAGAGSPFLSNCTTDGTATVGCDSTAVLSTGMTISGTNIAPGTTIASVTGAKTFVLSAPATGNGSGLSLTVYAEGAKASATFNLPFGLAFDSSGHLYVADRDNHSIRRIDGATELVSTFAGGSAGRVDGTGTAARFNNPVVLAMDGNNNLYVSDKLNHIIRKVTTPAAVVTTLAGTGTNGAMDGKADVATFDCPSGLAIDSGGNLLVADAQNHLLRRIAIKPLTVAATVAGTNVSAPLDAAALGLNSYTTYFIRWVDVNAGTTQMQGDSFFLVDPPAVVTTAASNLTPDSAQINGTVHPNQSPTTVLFDYSTEPNLLGSLKVETFLDSLATPGGQAVDAAGNIYLAVRAAHKIVKIDPAGAMIDFAGSGAPGHADNADALQAQFDHPVDVAIDAAGNLYIADEVNHRIRMISAIAPHAVTTIAGSGVAGFGDDGDARNGKLLYPCGVAVNGAGSKIYVADRGNHRIRLISGTGPRTLGTLAGDGTAGFADGPGATAQFNNPTGVVVDAAENLYIADRDNHRVRVVASATGNQVLTVAGSGTAGFLDGADTSAQFASPSGLAIDRLGNLYVADRDNHRLRLIDDAGGVSTIAGSGTAGLFDSPAGSLIPATGAQFNLPSAVAIAVGATPNDPVTLYLADPGNNAVRKISRDPLLSVAAVQSPLPTGALADPTTPVHLPVPENLWPGGTYYYRVRGENQRGESVGGIESFTTPTRQQLAVFDGPSTSAGPFSNAQVTPIDFGITPLGTPVSRDLTISNAGQWPLNINNITVPAGYEITAGFTVGGPAVAVAGGNSLVITVSLTGTPGAIYSGTLEISSDDPDQPSFTVPITGVVLDPPSVTTLPANALNNPAPTLTTATLNAEINPNGTSTTVWFEYSRDPELDGLDVTTVAGSTPGFMGGPGAIAKFDEPRGVATDAAGNIYVADTANHRIRLITPDGTASTLAGDGTAGFANGPAASAQFNRPVGVVLRDDGTLFVTDSMNHLIRAISPGGIVTTHSGTGEAAFTDGIAAAARFSQPWGLAIDSAGTLYVADRDNNRIRTVASDGTAGTLAGTGAAGAGNGPGNTATFTEPVGIAVNSAGLVFVTEGGRNLIRRIQGNGTVDTLTPAFSNPEGLAIDAEGRILVADSGSHLIKRVTLTPTVAVATFAGSGAPGSTDGLGDVAQFDHPLALTTDQSGDVIVGELTNGTIRRIASNTIVVEAATNLNGTNPLSVSLPVTNLISHTDYYVRAYATNGGGTTVGPAILTFMARPRTPFELWQVANFTPVQLLDPLISGPLADPNGDGVVNLLKYTHLIAPFDPSKTGLPVVRDKAGRLTLTYTRNLAATDLASAVECSPDGLIWTAANDLTIQTFDNNGNTEQVLASVPLAPDTSPPPGSPQPSKLIRLSISLITLP